MRSIPKLRARRWPRFLDMLRSTLVIPALLVALAVPRISFSEEVSSAMTQHARGSFTVDIQPLTPPPAPGLARYSINKSLQGELTGTTQGELFSAGDPKLGTAGYVAIEVVTGELQGRHGSFALQHMATMDVHGRHMTVLVVPGSGTGQLEGIAGTFTIDQHDGRHDYVLDYTVPGAAVSP